MERANRIDFTIQEALAYYILGYQNYKEEIRELKKKHWLIILKYILWAIRDEESIEEILQENELLFNKVQFSWKLSLDDFFAYATCIFYVLTNREKTITPEKIVKEFSKEIYRNHPRKTMKEANLILDSFFPNVK